MEKEVILNAVEALKIEAATMRNAVKQICNMSNVPAVAPLAEMLGLNAESTKKYRDNVANKLTAKIPYYREVVTPDGKGIITLAYRMQKKSNGYFTPVECDFWAGLVDAICNDECKHIAVDVNAYYDADDNPVSREDMAKIKEAKEAKSVDNKRKNALKTLNITNAMDALKLALEFASEEERETILTAIATLAK